MSDWLDDQIRAAEVRALRDSRDALQAMVDCCRELVADWPDDAHEALAEIVGYPPRAATADPTPLPDLLKAARERGRRAAVLPPDAADPTPPPETHDDG